MGTERKNILSIDAGGVKGIYTLTIIDEIAEKFYINFNKCFDYYIGTSIGAVIATALADNIHPREIQSGLSSMTKEIEKNGHKNLLNRLFNWIDNLFKKKQLNEVSKELFIPVYNFSKKSIAFFSNSCETQKNVLISDLLKAACSDIRLTSPYKIVNKGEYSDGGFFAYDPVLYFLRSMSVNLDSINILSIGSGIIQNFSGDLDQGKNFDIIYDTFLFDQFETTKFHLNTLSNSHNIKYLRISEFPFEYSGPLTIEYLIELAKRRMKSFSFCDFDPFI